MSRRNLAFFLVTAVGLALDQLTKAWIVANVELHYGEIPIIPGLLSIVHARNPGAAMGMLQDFEYRFVLFGVFTVIAVAVILDLFRRLPRDDWYLAGTLGLVLSGAVGNAIDRARQQYVIDFIRVYTDHPPLKAWLIERFGTYEWPSFNVADSALLVGVGLFLVHYVIADDREQELEPRPADEGSAEG